LRQKVEEMAIELSERVKESGIMARAMSLEFKSVSFD